MSEAGGVDRIDAQIHHLIYEMPGKLDTAVAAIEDGVQFANLKSRSQGYAILAGAAKEVAADWISNNRTLLDVTGGVGGSGTAPGLLYSYGFIGTYGVGFGMPLILGRPDDYLSCSGSDFTDLIHKYGLEYGISNYLSGYEDGATAAAIGSRIAEFDLLVRSKLNCILSQEDSYIEAAEAVWALDELSAAFSTRLSLAS